MSSYNMTPQGRDTIWALQAAHKSVWQAQEDLDKFMRGVVVVVLDKRGRMMSITDTERALRDELELATERWNIARAEHDASAKNE